MESYSDKLTVKELRAIARKNFGPGSWIWEARKADLIQALNTGELPQAARAKVKPSVKAKAKTGIDGQADAKAYQAKVKAEGGKIPLEDAAARAKAERMLSRMTIETLKGKYQQVFGRLPWETKISKEWLVKALLLNEAKAYETSLPKLSPAQQRKAAAKDKAWKEAQKAEAEAYNASMAPACLSPTYLESLSVKQLRAEVREHCGPGSWIWKARKADLIQRLVAATNGKVYTVKPKETAKKPQVQPQEAAVVNTPVPSRDELKADLMAEVRSEFSAELNSLRAELAAAKAELAQLKAAPQAQSVEPPAEHRRLKTTGPRRTRRRSSLVSTANDIAFTSDVDLGGATVVDTALAVLDTTAPTVELRAPLPAVAKVLAVDPWTTPAPTASVVVAAIPVVARPPLLLPAATVSTAPIALLPSAKASATVETDEAWAALRADVAVQAAKATTQAAKARAAARAARAAARVAQAQAETDAWSRAAAQTKRWMKAKAAARAARKAVADAQFARAWDLAGKVGLGY